MSTGMGWKPAQKFKVRPEQQDSFKPYDHQVAASTALTRYFTEQKQKAGVLVVPTGGGKTAIATRWVLQNAIGARRRVLWLTHRRGLLCQAFRSFERFHYLAVEKDELNLITVSSRDKSWSNVDQDHDVVFSTIQSAATENSIGFVRTIRSGQARSSGATDVPSLTWEAREVTAITLAASGYLFESLVMPGRTPARPGKFLAFVTPARGARLFQA